jgi:hypothetical protein
MHAGHLSRAALAGLLGAALLAVSGTNAQDTGYGTVKPYSLSVEALKGPNSTDVTLTVSAAKGYAAPDLAKKILLKAIDENGDALWAKNYLNVPLSEGRAKYAYDDLARHMPVSAQMNIKNEQSVNGEVLKAGTVVMLRPDLKVVSAMAEPRVRVRQAVNVEVVVQELNQDLGASFDACVREGEAVLDSLTGAYVDPGGVSSLVFTFALDKPGVHTLTAEIKNVQPGDFDATNHTLDFQIEVIDSQDVPVQYWLSYYDSNWDYASQSKWNYNWYYEGYGNYGSQGWSEYSSKGSSESLYYSSWQPQTIHWPVEKLSVNVQADGAQKIGVQLNDLQPTWSYSWSGSGDGWSYSYSYQTHYTWLPEENAWIYVQSYSSTYTYGGTTYSWQGSGVYLNRYAADYVYRGKGHNTYWGPGYSGSYDWDYSGSYQAGTFWHARQSLSTDVVLTDDGINYGGTGTAPNWYHYEQPWTEWSYSDQWGSYSGHYQYESWSAYGYGWTQP